jgi:CheY-like chemotaxis protein
MAHLLVVDDDRDLRETLAEVLMWNDHEVRVAKNGDEGLQQLEEELPDAVLLDVEMPRMGGAEMAHLMLLRNCGKEKVPVVLLSGVVGLPKLAESVGTPYYLAKPYRIEDMLPVLERALKERIPPRPGGAP